MTRSTARATLVLAGWPTAGLALLRVAWLPGLDPLRPWTTFEQQPAVRTLPLALALAVLVLAAWLALTVLLTLLSRLPGLVGTAALTVLGHVSPAVLRRVAEVALGATAAVGLASGTAQAAGIPRVAVQQQAATGQQTSPAFTLDRPASATAPSDELPSLDRPSSSSPSPSPHAWPSLDRPAADPSRGLALVTSAGPRSLAHQAKAVRVKVGDSLWRIAARALPYGTSDDQIEHAWHRWYAANRAVIGDDPNLLLPGQLLTPPPS